MSALEFVTEAIDRARWVLGPDALTSITLTRRARDMLLSEIAKVDRMGRGWDRKAVVEIMGVRIEERKK